MRLYILYILTVLNTTTALAESAEYYLKLALENNARLSAERQSAAAAESEFHRETIFPENPEFMVGFMNIPVTTFPALNRDPMSNFSIGFTQRIALPWEFHYRTTAAQLRAKTNATNLALVKSSLRYEVMEKLNSIRYFSERSKKLIEVKKTIQSTIRLLAVPRKDSRTTAGTILEAQAAFSSAENEILTNNFELEKAWLELEALCGEKLIRTDASNIFPAWENPTLPSVDTTTAIRNSLTYKKTESEVLTERALLSLSHAALFPEVKLSAAYMMRQPIPGSSMIDDMVSISASTPLPIFYPIKTRHEIESRHKRLSAAELLLVETERQLYTLIKTEVQKISALRALLENYNKTILPAHSSAHRLHLTSINLIGGNPAEALNAYRMYITAAEERLRLIRDANSARLKIDYLISSADDTGVSP